MIKRWIFYLWCLSLASFLLSYPKVQLKPNCNKTEWLLHYFSRAVTANYYKVGVLNKNVFSYSSGDRKSEIRVPGGHTPSEASSGEFFLTSSSSWCSFAWRHITPISASRDFLFGYLCVLFCLLKGTPTGFRAYGKTTLWSLLSPHLDQPGNTLFQNKVAVWGYGCTWTFEDTIQPTNVGINRRENV